MFRKILVLALFAYATAFGPAMRMVKKAAVVSVAALTVGSGAAFAKDLDNGSQVFQGNCAACHAGGNNVIQSEKTLRKDALEQYLAGGLKEESIITQVR
jgi:cytochrome c6